MAPRSSYFAQFRHVLGANLADRALGLVASILIARHLGTADLGRLGPALVLAAILARVADCGVSAAVQRDVAAMPDASRRVVAQGLGIRVISGGLVIIVAWIYSLATVGWSSATFVPLVACVAAVVSGWQQVLTALWLGAARTRFVAVSQVSYRFVYLAFVAAAVLLHGTIVHIVTAMLAAAVLQLLFGAVITRRAFFAPRVEMRWAANIPLIRDSWPLGVASIAVMSYDRIDTLIASWYLPAAAVGSYFAAYGLYSATLLVSNAITTVSYSRFSRDAGQGAFSIGLYRQALIRMVFLGGAIGALCFTLAPAIVRVVYGRPFDSSSSLLRILALALPFLFANNLAGVALNAIRRHHATMVITIAGLALNLVLNVLTVPRYGALAAAWTTVVTELAIILAEGGVLEYHARSHGIAGAFVTVPSSSGKP